MLEKFILDYAESLPKNHLQKSADLWNEITPQHYITLGAAKIYFKLIQNLKGII